ncbi:hypothetical protein V8C86DRAFT_3163189 [Haematococcus lacustris]
MNMVEMLPGSSLSNPCLTVPFNAWGSTSLFHDMAAKVGWSTMVQRCAGFQFPAMQFPTRLPVWTRPRPRTVLAAAKPEKAGRPPPRLSFLFPKADRNNETPPLDFAPIATNLLVVVISVVLSGFVMPYFSLPKEVAEIKTDLEVAKLGLSDQIKALDVKVDALDAKVDMGFAMLKKDLADVKERVSTRHTSTDACTEHATQSYVEPVLCIAHRRGSHGRLAKLASSLASPSTVGELVLDKGHVVKVES